MVAGVCIPLGSGLNWLQSGHSHPHGLNPYASREYTLFMMTGPDACMHLACSVFLLMIIVYNRAGKKLFYEEIFYQDF